MPGATVGRVANRTCRGRFELVTGNIDGGCGEDGDASADSCSKKMKTSYTLAVNNGENHLHGGNVGFDKKMWAYELVSTPDEIGVKFTCESPDGEEGTAMLLND